MTTCGFSDWVVLKDVRKHAGERRYEARLQALWPAVLLLPVFPLRVTLMDKTGSVTFGVCIQNHTHWIGPAMGEAICSPSVCK